MNKRNIFIILILILLFFKLNLMKYFEFWFLKKKEYSDSEIQDIFVRVSKKYPEVNIDWWKKFEKMWRLETNHFKSSQFKKCYTPGMVAKNRSFPYGWSSLKERYPGGEKNFFLRTWDLTYIGFPDLENAVDFVAWFLINKRGGKIESWYSLEPMYQHNYLQKLKNIRSRFF